MKKFTLFKTFTLAALMMSLATSGWGQPLLVENFDYPVGAALTAHGWTAHSTPTPPALPNTITVTAPTITHTGYLGSGIGNQVTLTTSGEDVNRLITAAPTSGTVYASFLVRVTSATLTGDYFFHVGATTIGTTFRGRVFVRRDADNKLAFGIAQSTTTTINYSAFAYDLNTTYLIVLRYEIIAGTTNDVASIFINPPLNAPIPTSGWITNTDAAGSDLAQLGSVALRQGGATVAAALMLDGIRVSTNWADIVGEPAAATPTISVSPSSLTGFSYVVGSGPSPQQLFTVFGTNLTGDITIAPPANYEISTGTGGAFVATNPVILTQTDGSVPDTTIYVRLKSGLSAGFYSESISLSSPGADSRTVSLTGRVLPTPANFRSAATGLWSAAATWEASPDGTVWLAADRFPEDFDRSILIRTGHVVTVSASVEADQIEIQDGATLVHTGGTFRIINDDTGHDVVVHPGGVFTFGVSPAPPFTSGATCLVQPGGILRVAATGLTGSGAVVHSTNMVFTTGSVLEYTPSGGFAASGVTFFPHVDAATIPIFRVTSVTASVGGSGNTIINGILEANSSFTWGGTGDKTFRNGIRGTGSLTQAAGSGQWLITGANAIIGGTGSFTLGIGLDIASGAHVRVTGNRTINTGLLRVLSGGSLTLESGHTLTIASTAMLMNNAGNAGLVLRSGASMIHNTDGVEATMERFFPGVAQWRLVSSPVANQAIDGPWRPTTHSHGYDFYAWSEQTATWLNLKVVANNITHFLPDRGYLVSFQSADLTQSFAGVLNNGNITVPITRLHHGPHRGANLLGNPYPSSIEWNLADRTLFADHFAYIYDPLAGEGGGYVTVDGANPGALIAPNQGFFVIKAADGTGNFTFTNTMRVHGGVFKTAVANPTITITLQKGEFYDRAQIVQLQGATTARERSDALKFFSYNPLMPQVFTMSSDGVQLAVNSTPPITEDASFTIGVLTPVTGTYTLQIDGLQDILPGRPAFLLDRVTGTSHNLREQPRISFHAAQSNTTLERFVLSFVQPTGVGNNLPEEATVIYFTNGMLHMQFAAEDRNRQLQVIDLSGRVVLSKSLHGMGNMVSVPLQIDNGVYIVRITGETSAINRRILVR